MLSQMCLINARKANFTHLLLGSPNFKLGYKLGAGLTYTNYFMHKTGKVSLKNTQARDNSNLDSLLSQGGNIKGTLNPTLSAGLVMLIHGVNALSLEYKHYFNSYVGFSSDISLNYTYYWQKKH
ncbi:hypothetical protein [Helicobacter sp. 11S02629-2]|uniref:hypothetical protein n=1 Tax=Helicobacter sp. 11S02629-2 TaxID=1476195 RepID=UPI000BA70D03|nr:hypothetical protein [Helicobacter sp. 11S02629-2]PAF44584.1 hypothetical protein BKH40_04935 [Helicobacter sp. 11S02629-2]